MNALMHRAKSGPVRGRPRGVSQQCRAEAWGATAQWHFMASPHVWYQPGYTGQHVPRCSTPSPAQGSPAPLPALHFHRGRKTPPGEQERTSLPPLLSSQAWQLPAGF